MGRKNQACAKENSKRIQNGKAKYLKDYDFQGDLEKSPPKESSGKLFTLPKSSYNIDLTSILWYIK